MELALHPCSRLITVEYELARINQLKFCFIETLTNLVEEYTHPDTNKALYEYTILDAIPGGDYRSWIKVTSTEAGTETEHSQNSFKVNPADPDVTIIPKGSGEFTIAWPYDDSNPLVATLENLETYWM